jgi:hypothetical protein
MIKEKECGKKEADLISCESVGNASIDQPNILKTSAKKNSIINK